MGGWLIVKYISFSFCASQGSYQYEEPFFTNIFQYQVKNLLIRGLIVTIVIIQKIKIMNAFWG